MLTKIRLILLLFLCAMVSGLYAQTLLSVSPASAVQGKVYSATITGVGTNFTAGTNTVKIVDNNSNEVAFVLNVQPVSANLLGIVALISPLSLPGQHHLIVSNATNGVMNLNNAITIAANPASISGMTPNTASAGQTLNVTVTGVNTTFVQGSTQINFFKGASQTTDITVNSITVNSATSLTANLTAGSGITTNTSYAMVVNTTADGYMLLNNALAVAGSSGGSSISGVSPSSGYAGQTLNVTISGTNTSFNQGSNTVTFFKQGSPTTQLLVNSTSATSATALVANITVPANASLAVYDVTVNNSITGLLSFSNAFIVGPPPSPAIVSVSPNSSNRGQTLNVTITGINCTFNQGSNTVSIFGQGSNTTSLVVNSLNATSANSLTANISVPPLAIAGLYDLTVTNSVSGLAIKTDAFTVTTPTLSGTISPDVGRRGQTLSVTISGVNTSFTSGSNTISFYRSGSPSSFVTASQINVIDNNTLNATVTVSPGALLGFYGIRVNSSIDGPIDLTNFFVVQDSITIGLEKTSNSDAFGLYPNPANGYVYIQSNEWVNEEITVSLMSLEGRTVVKSAIRAEQGKARFDFGESMPAKGIYFLKVESPQGIGIRRLMIP